MGIGSFRTGSHGGSHTFNLGSHMSSNAQSYMSGSISGTGSINESDTGNPLGFTTNDIDSNSGTPQTGTTPNNAWPLPMRRPRQFSVGSAGSW
jgi:hypothetical protein